VYFSVLWVLCTKPSPCTVHFELVKHQSKRWFWNSSAQLYIACSDSEELSHLNSAYSTLRKENLKFRCNKSQIANPQKYQSKYSLNFSFIVFKIGILQKLKTMSKIQWIINWTEIISRSVIWPSLYLNLSFSFYWAVHLYHDRSNFMRFPEFEETPRSYAKFQGILRGFRIFYRLLEILKQLRVSAKFQEIIGNSGAFNNEFYGTRRDILRGLHAGLCWSSAGGPKSRPPSRSEAEVVAWKRKWEPRMRRPQSQKVCHLDTNPVSLYSPKRRHTGKFAIITGTGHNDFSLQKGGLFWPV